MQSSIHCLAMDWIVHSIVFITGMVASFVGTTTGGIGLLIVPVLIFLGLPSPIAIATCRLGLVSSNITSLWQFHKYKHIDYSIAIPILILSVIGAVIGSSALLGTPSEAVEKFFGLFIIAIVGISLLNKEMGKQQKKTAPLQRIAGYIQLFFISILSGYFSAGTGLLGRTVLMKNFGQTFLQSAGTRKLQAFAISVGSLVIYLTFGAVHWPYAITLLIGTGIGSYTGAAFAIKKGDEWVRKLFIVVVILSAIALLLR